MFIFPEGSFKKGANTVCNFLLHVIEREFNPAKHEIFYLFPVRGHSFSQSDRNFGTYTQKKNLPNQ